MLCLFIYKQEEARKALESALGGKKSEYEKWDKEIKRREEAGGGDNSGGGGWWGRWFGGSGDGHFWQEAQQASLAILGIIVMVSSCISFFITVSFVALRLQLIWFSPLPLVSYSSVA